MRSSAVRSFAAVCCVLVSAGALAAQQSGKPDSLPRPRRDSSVVLPSIEVIGTRPLERIPGSGHILDRATLVHSRVLTTTEAMRKVPGVVARDEDAFGLRPNIGIRGLSPTRSSRVLLLEDGVPFTIAPYGDNASYYHPPIDRFEQVEVLKGSGQILFGPQTIGGVINYITPAIPLERLAGSLMLSGGSRGYVNGSGRISTKLGGAGVMFNAMRKQGDGNREHTGSRLDDATLRTLIPLGGSHSLALKGNYYHERSNITYSGLTEAEYAANPYQNPFAADSMFLTRWGASAAHRMTVGHLGTLTTTLYASTISRNWWRQSSNSGQRPNDASDPACGGMANLLTTCGNEGRLRTYDMLGLEPRLGLPFKVLGVSQRLDAGVRAHFERQDRRQVNGARHDSREPAPAGDVNGGLRERNIRTNEAYAAYLQDQLSLGAFTLTPGVRIEHVRYHRSNELGTAPVKGSTALTQWIPGLGATWAVARTTTLFAGVHRGFAPPRTEDIIDNSSGGVVDLDPELSWNYELGVRTSPVAGLHVEATAFRMDFQNQIIPQSLAGGTGAALTSAGETLHQGLELSGRLDLGTALDIPHDVFVEAAWTWLPTARFEGERFVYVGTGGSDVVGKVYAGQNAGSTREQVRVTGKRLPYAPRHLLTATLGYAHPSGVSVRAEGVYVGAQFGDALNTSVLAPDGQQGPIPATTIFNFAADYTVPRIRTTAFVTVKNAFDRLYVADRTRGLLPGMPRMVQVGVEQRF
ncbi:MAG: TonB-dependent receptor family protein [Gemmatimonadota bacterium]